MIEHDPSTLDRCNRNPVEKSTYRLPSIPDQTRPDQNRSERRAHEWSTRRVELIPQSGPLLKPKASLILSCRVAQRRVLRILLFIWLGGLVLAMGLELGRDFRFVYPGTATPALPQTAAPKPWFFCISYQHYWYVLG